MNAAARCHRLDGLEPDNWLAFLALLGLLRSLEEADCGARPEERLWPRVSWRLDAPPWRPVLHLAREVDRATLCARLEEGIAAFHAAYQFDGRKMPDFEPEAYRQLAEQAVRAADRPRLDILAAIATDQVRREKGSAVASTPLCLLSGQGHQDFLPRLATVPFRPSVPAVAERGRLPDEDGERNLDAALFVPWDRDDDATNTFRWDPNETARQALMAGDPTDRSFKLGTELGANRLAAIGLSILPVVADRTGPDRAATIPGCLRTGPEPVLAWPIWKEPATLAAIRALLGHPGLGEPRALAGLGVVAVFRAAIVSIGKFKNVLLGECL